MKTKNENAVVYARFSSHNQQEQSIEGQLAAAQRYAEQQGYTIIKEYIDRAKTGRNDNREAFQQMIKDTSKKNFSVIIVWKVDRFGRNRREININKARCHDNGVRVEYVAETIPDSDEGVILESVLEGFAEYYSRQLSRNVRRGQAESIKNLKSIGGNYPLGYTTDEEKHFIIEPKGAEIVKLIFKLYTEDCLTISQIVKYLEANGIKTGHKLSFNAVNNILKNERYLGIYKYGGVRIEGGIPRIISDETFRAAQKQLKTNQKLPSSKWKMKDYLLTGKLFCGKCGSPMSGESGTSSTANRKYAYYVCNGKRKKKICDKKSVKKDFIEDAVCSMTAELLQDEELLSTIIDATWEHYRDEYLSNREVSIIKEEINSTNKAIDNIVNAVAQGMPYTDNVKKQIDDLNEKLKKLNTKLSELDKYEVVELTKEHIEFFLRKAAALDLTDYESKRQLIKTFVNAVFVYDDKLTVVYNYGGDSETVTLKDIEGKVRSSPLNSCQVKSTASVVLFLFCSNGLEPEAREACRGEEPTAASGRYREVTEMKKHRAMRRALFFLFKGISICALLPNFGFNAFVFFCGGTGV